MERIRQIMKHPLYITNQKRIDEMENSRIFCRHGMEHALDVARLMYIFALERQVDVSKDVIYATALLHDIGRAIEYEKKHPHHEAGGELAERILQDCTFTDKERVEIVQAIQSHKHNRKTYEGADNLQSLLYEADKRSRACYSCKASEECYWESDKRNSYLEY